MNLHANVGVAAQLRDLHQRKIRKDPTFPILPNALVQRHQRLAELSHHGESRSPARRRGGIQAQVMTPRRIARQEIYIRELQGLHAALLVGPTNCSAPDHDLCLRKEPFADLLVARRGPRHIKSGDKNFSLGCAAHIQVGPLDVQLVESPVQQ